MTKFVFKLLLFFVAATAIWAVHDYNERKEYMEVMARRERALDEENRQRELEQIKKDLDVSTLSNQPGVIRYTREIPKD